MPNRVTLPPDYHTHTRLCKHAEGMPADYIHAALDRGLKGIACTDHNPCHDGYDPEHRMTPRQFELYKREVRYGFLPAGFGLRLGIEADYYPGCETYLGEWLETHAFDIVLGSVHYLDFWGLFDSAKRQLWNSVDVRATWTRYFELIGRLVDSGLYDVVGHIDLPKKFGHRPDEASMREMSLPLLDKIAASGMSIEINTSGLLHPIQETYPSAQMLSWARERDISIVFGSDAHAPDRVGQGFEQAVQLARQAGYLEYALYKKRSKDTAGLP